MMQGDIDSWQDTEAEGQLSSVMFALENLLHHPGDSSLLLKADIQSGGTGGIPLLAKQIMDQRAPREESDEWMEWKDRFPHFRFVVSLMHALGRIQGLPS